MEVKGLPESILQVNEALEEPLHVCDAVIDGQLQLSSFLFEVPS